MIRPIVTCALKISSIKRNEGRKAKKKFQRKIIPNNKKSRKKKTNNEQELIEMR